jgi:hypothetical protein
MCSLCTAVLDLALRFSWPLLAPCWEWTSDKFETTGKGVVLASSFATLGLVVSLLATLGLTVSLAKLGLTVSLAKLGLVVHLVVSSRCSFFLSFFFVGVSR